MELEIEDAPPKFHTALPIIFLASVVRPDVVKSHAMVTPLLPCGHCPLVRFQYAPEFKTTCKVLSLQSLEPSLLVEDPTPSALLSQR